MEKGTKGAKPVPRVIAVWTDGPQAYASRYRMVVVGPEPGLPGDSVIEWESKDSMGVVTWVRAIPYRLSHKEKRKRELEIYYGLRNALGAGRLEVIDG